MARLGLQAGRFGVASQQLVQDLPWRRIVAWLHDLAFLTHAAPCLRRGRWLRRLTADTQVSASPWRWLSFIEWVRHHREAEGGLIDEGEHRGTRPDGRRRRRCGQSGGLQPVRRGQPVGAAFRRSSGMTYAARRCLGPGDCYDRPGIRPRAIPPSDQGSLVADTARPRENLTVLQPVRHPGRSSRRPPRLRQRW